MLSEFMTGVKEELALTSSEPFTLRSQRLGCLPIVNFFLNRMGLAERLQSYLLP